MRLRIRFNYHDFWAAICVVLSTGCATKTSQQRMEESNASSRAHPATIYSEVFYMNYNNPPDRNVKNWDFYYKHCKLVGRNNPAPTRSEWACSEP